MLALQRISGLVMVEGLDIPLDQWEIFSVRFGVTARALLTRAGIDVISRMQSLARSDTRRDLAMAVETLERRGCSEFVATGTVGRPVQRCVRA